MVRILFFMALMLAAAPALSQGVLRTSHSGLVGGYSAERLVSRHRHFSVYAQASIVRRGDQVAYAVTLRHGLNDGSILYVDEAWSFGHQLRFEALPPDRICGGLRCLYGMGMVIFSAQDFAQLTRTGLDMQVIGSEGPIALSIPAQVFAQAAHEAARLLP